MSQYEINSRNKVKRVPERGSYDHASVHAVLDAHFLCHVGFSYEGQPYVIPTAYGREGNTIYLHGATKSRLLVALKTGIPCCLTVTLIDGLVMARSIFHHSMNYRSADYDLPIWAGVIPMGLKTGAPETDPDMRSAQPVSPSVQGYEKF